MGGHDERGRGTDQQLMGPGQRAVVRDRWVGLVVADGHDGDGRDRRHGQGDEHDEEPPAGPAHDHGQGASHGQRPDDVELLLDGERPQVADRRCRRERLEIALAGEDEPPVRDVAQRREEVPAERALGDGIGRGRPDRDDRDEHEQRRQQPSGTAVPELDEVDATRPHALADQEGRDEEARQDEEEVDAEEPALQARHAEVVGEDEGDSQTAGAIERPDVRHGRGAGSAGGVEGGPGRGDRRGRRVGAASEIVHREIGHGRGLSGDSGCIGGVRFRRHRDRRAAARNGSTDAVRGSATERVR